MTDLMAADFGIRQLQSRYMEAVWRRDYQAFGDCFAEDAQWHIAGRVLRGRRECVAFLEGIMPLFDRVRMTMQCPIIGISEGSVCGRTDVLEHNILTDRSRRITIGTYFDRFAEAGGRWRFATHYYQLYYIGPPDMSGDFHELVDFGPPPAMPPAGAPTVAL